MSDQTWATAEGAIVGEQDVQVAVKLLDGVVEEEVLAGYLKLVESDGCPGEDAETLLGGAALVRTLIARGMAHMSPADPTNPPRLIAAPADLALEAAAAELYGEWREHHNRLLNVHQRMRDLRPARTLLSGDEHPTAQVITDREEITQLSHSLINLARSDMMSMDNCLQETPIQEISVIPPLPRFQGSVRYRSIYQTSCLEHPVIAKAIEASVEAGEEARVLPEVGMKMKLVDDTVAMLPLTRTGMGGALILRAAVIIEDLRKYFEMLWERATPLGSEQAPSDRSPLNNTQLQVLLLLSQGLQDEAIARRTGQSLQTVRRHISTIRTLLDAETRFAAGVAAVRRGWLK